jgi:hypothetical protein
VYWSKVLSVARSTSASRSPNTSCRHLARAETWKLLTAEPDSTRQDDRGGRLHLDSLQLVEFDFAIQERKEGCDEAKIFGA